MKKNGDEEEKGRSSRKIEVGMRKKKNGIKKNEAKKKEKKER